MRKWDQNNNYSNIVWNGEGLSAFPWDTYKMTNGKAVASKRTRMRWTRSQNSAKDNNNAH